jgi:Domain of unknown function (DUF4863)
MDIAAFKQLISGVTQEIGNRALDGHLQRHLNRALPASSSTFKSITNTCQIAIAEGWMCQRNGAGIRYGRVLKPCPELGGFSVDVVEMNKIAGPYHAHPNGEIDMVMPIDSQAEFDGCREGWLVYGPNTAHRPTVTNGRAVILYLLPEGAIHFTAEAP